MIERAIEEGDLLPTDPELTALSLMGVGTGTHTWYWRQQGRSGEIDFEQLAPELAQSTIRVMVVDDDKGTKLRFGNEYLAKVGIF